MRFRDVFAEQFLLLKNTYNLSYNDLSGILGANTKATINDWVKSQKGFPSGFSLVLISDIFAIHLDWLLGRIDKPYSEEILTSLEKQSIPMLKVAINSTTIIPSLPEKYENQELRRSNYSFGQRANLVYITLSSYYRTVFDTYTSKQLETGDLHLNVDDLLKVQKSLLTYIFENKDVIPLIQGELDKPIFDLEEAIKQQSLNKNK